MFRLPFFTVVHGLRLTAPFSANGEAYLKDLPRAEMHRLDAGHFAVEDNLGYISEHIHSFYRDVVASKRAKR